VKSRSRTRISAALAAGVLFLSVHLANSRAAVIVLTDSAMIPLAAIAATAVRWLPDFTPEPLNLAPLIANSDFAERFAGKENEEWAGSPGELEAPSAHLENVALVRAGTATHFDYRTPTTLHAGYGYLFEEESWKLSKSSKQGVEEPSHFYLKLTFRF
jgi:hypothetical protein